MSVLASASNGWGWEETATAIAIVWAVAFCWWALLKYGGDR